MTVSNVSCAHYIYLYKVPLREVLKGVAQEQT